MFIPKFFGYTVLLSFFLMNCKSTDSEGSELCFVGDSITYLWDIENYFPTYYIHKHAKSGAILEDLKEQNFCDCKGIPVVLLIGTNNLQSGFDSDTLTDTFINDFTNKYVFQAIKFDASKIYALSILPRTIKPKNKNINLEIRKLNKAISNALKNSGISYKFIDVQDVFLDSDKNIHEDFYYDGLHLSQEGYEILSQKVLEAL